MCVILLQVWYPTTVATLSRRTRDLVDEAFAQSVDPELRFLAATKLHDFGFRGCRWGPTAARKVTQALLNVQLLMSTLSLL